jgi:hypothetical protein
MLLAGKAVLGFCEHKWEAGKGHLPCHTQCLFSSETEQSGIRAVSLAKLAQCLCSVNLKWRY